MAGVWKLPIIYFCENNRYGMGTSQERASHNTKFHTRGDRIPGFQFDAQNVLMVREAIKWAGRYVVENGPLFLEADTYRYHGHSMSDPGITYRTKEEIESWRARDPIPRLRDTLVTVGRLSDARAAAIEAEAAAEIEAAVEFARTSPDPDPRELERDVYA